MPMRLLALLAALAAAACAPAIGADTNQTVPDNAGTETVAPDAQANVSPADPAAPQSDFRIEQEWAISVDSCSDASWISAPLTARRGKQRFRCSQARIAYLPHKPGYTDTVVTFPGERGHRTLDLSGVWNDPRTLEIRTATLDSVTTIEIAGRCTGSFNRPGEAHFAGDPDADGSGDDGKASPLSCTLTSLQGDPIGAITFGTP
jgi:hypothetical protein